MGGLPFLDKLKELCVFNLTLFEHMKENGFMFFPPIALFDP